MSSDTDCYCNDTTKKKKQNEWRRASAQKKRENIRENRSIGNFSRIVGNNSKVGVCHLIQFVRWRESLWKKSRKLQTFEKNCFLASTFHRRHSSTPPEKQKVENVTKCFFQFLTQLRDKWNEYFWKPKKLEPFFNYQIEAEKRQHVDPALQIFLITH